MTFLLSYTSFASEVFQEYWVFEVIQEIFTHEVFSLLLRKKLIGLSLVAEDSRLAPYRFQRLVSILWRPDERRLFY